MKIVSFIEPTQPDVIQKILTHGSTARLSSPKSELAEVCRLHDEPPRAPPQSASPPVRELQYVSDLEFVDDPAPPEPVWSAD